MHAALTGVLASRNTTLEYFTSVLYPLLVEDSLSVGVAAPVDAVLWEGPNDVMSLSVPSLPSGTLVATIAYQSYDNAIPELMSVNVAIPQSGTLIETIVYKSYNDAIPELMSLAVATPQDGTLITTIAYQSYDNAIPESFSVNVATIQSGTLS